MLMRIKGYFGWGAVLVCLGLANLAQAKEMVSVNREKINMREGASTNHPVIWTLTRGYPLEVTGRKGRWLKVRDFERDVGWVYRPMLGKTPHVIVKGTVVNIRSGPGTGSAILDKAGYGEVMRTLAHRKDWVKVQRDGGLKGWIARKLVWGW
jgi:SH3-like domain-containing protein